MPCSVRGKLARMDLSLADGIYPALVVALAYVVLGLTGFASSLIAVPLLAWRWPLAEVVPLALVMDMLASLLMGGLNLREVRWDEFRALAPYTLVLVQLDEGPHLMAHATAGLRIGDRVRAGFFEHQGRTLVRFAATP